MLIQIFNIIVYYSIFMHAINFKRNYSLFEQYYMERLKQVSVMFDL